jgi:hypothetical protein
MDNKEIRKLLRDEGIPYEYLDRVIERHFEHKIWLAETLGLNKENDWRVKMLLPSDISNKPEIVSFLNILEQISEGKYRVLDLNFMWKGKNKVRVTKVINEYWHLLGDFCLFRDKYPIIYSAYSDFVCWWQDHCSRVAIHLHEKSKANFLCAYGDIVTNGREGIISLNPYDYFTLSGENCGFTSCIRIGGEYFNTVLAYLESGCALPVFCTNAGDERLKKVGRVMGYINETAVHFGRVYGTFQDADLLLLRTWVHGKIGGEWVKRAEPGLPNDSYENDGSAYIDSGCGIYTYRKEIDRKKFHFPCARCLACGYGTSRDCGGTCDDCARDGVCCTGCENYLDEDDMYCVDDRWYCSDCFNESYFVCSGCGEYCGNDYGCEVIARMGRIRTYCPSCQEDIAWKCEGCNQYFHNEYYSPAIADDLNYCPDCTLNLLRECSCGEWILTDDICDCTKEVERKAG